MNRQNLSPDEIWDSKPFGFTQGVIAEGKKMLFVSGQAGMNKASEVVGKDFESQCKQAFENIAIILRHSNADFNNVVKVTAFLTNISNLTTFGKIAADYFKGTFPAQSVFEVKSLALPDLEVEVEAIVVL